jgi:DNA-binding FadR family transcriptional regulator
MLMRDHLEIPQSAESVTGELNTAHRAIAEALIDRDGELAERLLAEHLDRVSAWIRPSEQNPRTPAAGRSNGRTAAPGRSNARKRTRRS